MDRYTMELEMSFAKAPYDQIPLKMRQPLINYVINRVEPGSFLKYLICNNLTATLAHADGENLPLIKTYVRWFYNETPSGLFGELNYEKHIRGR